MSYLLLLINLGLVVGLFVCVYGRRQGAFSGTVLSPFVLLAVFQLLTTLDFQELFSSVAGASATRIIGFYRISSQSDVIYAWTIYTAMAAASTIGAVVALMSKARVSAARAQQRFVHHPKQPVRVGVLFLCLSYVAMAVLLWRVRADGIFAVAGARQTFFRDNQLILIGCALQIPSIIVVLNERQVMRSRVYAFLLLNVALVVFTGSRGAIFFLSLVFLVKAVFEGVRPRLRWLAWATPAIVAMLIVVRFYTREASSASVSDFVQDSGGVSEMFFGGSEIATAEALTIITRESGFSREPFSSVIGLLMFPIPREMVPVKPMGASASFTEIVAPVRWETTKSEIITSGYGDLVMQFGPFGAICALAVVSFAWTRAMLRLCVSSAQVCALWMPVLMWWMLVFLRADIYNVGQTFWPCVLVVGTYSIFRHRTRRAVSNDDVDRGSSVNTGRR